MTKHPGQIMMAVATAVGWLRGALVDVGTARLEREMCPHVTKDIFTATRVMKDRNKDTAPPSITERPTAGLSGLMNLEFRTIIQDDHAVNEPMTSEETKIRVVDVDWIMNVISQR